MLTDTDPITAFSTGLLVGGGALLIVAWLFRRRWAEADQARRRIEAVAVKAREILAGSPDGLFVWDRASGGITCSRKLASLLALADGTKSRFEDVAQRFDDDSARRLNASVKFLHEEGRRFEIVLTTADSAGKRLIQAVGARAQGRDGDVLADLLWMRDISAAAKLLIDLTGETDLPEARDLHLRGLLDALPFPIWLRDGDLKVVFTNQAALSQRIAGPDDAQAETARDEARPVTRDHEIERAGEPVTVSVTECPLENGDDEDGPDDEDAAGLIGYAFPKGADTDMGPAPAPEPMPDASVTDAVLAGLGTGIAIYGADTRLAFHNAAFREMWRLDAGWLGEGRDFGEVLEHLRAERRLPEVPDFRAYKVEQLQLFDDADGPQLDPTGDLMHLPDGRTLRAVTHALPGGGLAFSYDDVTDQLDLESAVNARDAVHRATLEHLSEAVAVFGSDGRLKLFNEAFLALWNLQADALNPDTHAADFIDAVRGEIADDGDWEATKTQVHTAMTAREPARAELALRGGRIMEFSNGPLPDGGVLVSFRRLGDGEDPAGGFPEETAEETPEETQADT